MNCPKCGKEMLEVPPFERHRRVLKYFLCFHCVPVIRVIEKCKWMGEASMASPFNWKWQTMKVDWCTKMECFCDPTSAPEGYIFCPQIREWQEKHCGWVRQSNREFEKKAKAKKKAFFERCRKIYEGTRKHG